jgi:hypothetical protein
MFVCSLGKIIQTLTRIVDGRAKKSDKTDGYGATTYDVRSAHLLLRVARFLKSVLPTLTPRTFLLVLPHHAHFFC